MEEEIINELKKNLVIMNPKLITQEEFDRIIDTCIKHNLMEVSWRMALTYCEVSDYDYTKIIDFYIDKRDSYYLSELLYVIGEDRFKIKNTYYKVVNTNDDKFISEFLKDMKIYYVVDNVEEVKKIIDSY